MNVLEQRNAELVTEFDRYVREHPDFAERIPDNALVAMLVEGDEEFNRWSQEGAKRQAEKGQPIVYVKIKRIQPIRSRIQEMEISASAGPTRGVLGPALSLTFSSPGHDARRRATICPFVCCLPNIFLVFLPVAYRLMPVSARG